MKAKKTEHKVCVRSLGRSEKIDAYDMSEAYMRVLHSRGLAGDVGDNVCKTTRIKWGVNDWDNYPVHVVDRYQWLKD